MRGRHLLSLRSTPSFFLQLRPPLRGAGCSVLGAPRAAGRAQGSFSSNRHDSVTLFWLGGLSFSMTIFHLSPQPPRKCHMFLILHPKQREPRD